MVVDPVQHDVLPADNHYRQARDILMGHGWLCMASSFARYGVIQTDSTGSASHALDLTQPPLPGVQIQPGSTWGFQLWYRDPAMGPPGSNLSDALEITFCP